MNKRQRQKKYYSCKYNRPYKRAVQKETTGSKGEQEIRAILKQNHIEFKEQKTFPELRDEKLLRFDFSLEYDEKVICLIEYQGEQHFKPIEHFGGMKGFIARGTHDSMKYSFCASNKIPLFYINYDENIEKKMQEILTFYSVYKLLK